MTIMQKRLDFIIDQSAIVDWETNLSDTSIVEILLEHLLDYLLI